MNSRLFIKNGTDFDNSVLKSVFTGYFRLK
jgi:hypothetical protein